MEVFTLSLVWEEVDDTGLVRLRIGPMLRGGGGGALVDMFIVAIGDLVVAASLFVVERERERNGRAQQSFASCCLC